MSSGKDQHAARKAAVAALGRNLTRRARSRCELCEAQEDLRVVEVPPLPEEPEEDAALLGCARCRALVEGGRLPREPAELRFLETAVWAEVPPAQIAAVRLARRLRDAEVGWASDLLDGLWLDDAMQARIDA
jgi:protein PhnA